MAYMNQEKKKGLVALAKPILEKHGLKGTFAVRNHSTIVLTIKSGPVDFIENMRQTLTAAGRPVENMGTSIDVNVYWYKEHFSGKALEIIDGLVKSIGNTSRGVPDAACSWPDFQSRYLATISLKSLCALLDGFFNRSGKVIL